MPKFTVRVELHYADDDDYERLHSAMERVGFSRTITGSDGTEYSLPTAEYNTDGTDADAVLDLAKRAADSTGKRFAVLVTESQRRRWSGLDKA
jgi:hypothetical protein